jgi:hypothetical protein
MTELATTFRAVTLAERPEMEQAFRPQKERIWPEFMRHDVHAKGRWRYLSEVFPEFQIYLLNEAGIPVASANSLPLAWDGTLGGLPQGWAEALTLGVEGYFTGRPPNTLAALEIAIQPEVRGHEISEKAIEALRAAAVKHDFQALIAAVRPSLKGSYPLTPMERYVRWKREDGSPFDPWLRAHLKLGGEVLKVAYPSMVIEASIEDWEAWTCLRFPESGDFVIPEALAPIQIDREMNLGRYVEPNVWAHHPITTARLGG